MRDAANGMETVSCLYSIIEYKATQILLQVRSGMVSENPGNELVEA